MLLVVTVGVVTGFHYGLFTEAEQQRGILGLLLAVSVVVIAAGGVLRLVAGAIRQRLEQRSASRKRGPTASRVRFIRCGVVLIAAVMIVSIMIAAPRYLRGSSALAGRHGRSVQGPTAIIANPLIAVAWVVRRAGGGVRAALPALTSRRARRAARTRNHSTKTCGLGCFPNLLRICTKKRWSLRRSLASPSAFALVLLPFDKMILAFPTVEVACISVKISPSR